MTPLRIVLLSLLVPIAGWSLYLLFRSRHHCAHNDPLCRRDRPCIACYREIFSRAEGDAQTQSRSGPRR